MYFVLASNLLSFYKGVGKVSHCWLGVREKLVRENLDKRTSQLSMGKLMGIVLKGGFLKQEKSLKFLGVVEGLGRNSSIFHSGEGFDTTVFVLIKVKKYHRRSIKL